MPLRDFGPCDTRAPCCVLNGLRQRGGGPTIIPSAVLLGLFAVIGTASIAKRVFGRRDAG